MKENTKRWLGDIFISQVKNERAIEAAKTRPWWVALIMFIVGTFLPVIPLMVTQGNSYGSFFMNQAYKYDFDQAITEATVQLQKDGYTLEIKENQLLAYKGGEKLENTYVLNNDGKRPDTTPITSVVSNIDSVNKIRLNVYYSDRPYSGGEQNIVGLKKEISAIQYANGLDHPEAYNSEIHKDGAYTPSYVILYKDGILASIYKANSTTVAYSSYSGSNWKNTPATTDLIADLLKVDGHTTDVANIEYVKGVNANWRQVFDQTYANQKVISFWIISGIFYGLYLVLNIFMGFMMWLLTRGKMNPNRGLKITTCWWISGWTCVAPAILAMIVGFVYAPAQQVAFIVLLGLRTMWLSMRQLNPRY